LKQDQNSMTGELIIKTFEAVHVHGEGPWISNA